MKNIERTGLVATAALALTLSSFSGARAAETYKINVILPLTGSAAFVGQGQKDTLDALAEYENKNGGIKGQNVEFVFHDDQTSPQVAVQLTNSTLGTHPAVVMGSSLVGMCLAMAPLMKNGPVHYCLSPAIHPSAGSYTFSSSSSSVDQIAADSAERLLVRR